MHRHHVDPTVPFAGFVMGRSHGALITSATLRDGSGDPEHDWAAAEATTGGRHLKAPAIRAALPLPFDYGAQTRVLVVTDVRSDGAPDQVAAAYRALFSAAGGGALGLFTAIARLRGVHERIAGALDEAGLPLWAQHVDPLDPTTLVDIFRSETDACLLGTDAMRDGIDVPGRSLRLIVFDRVPWPRPDILHKARRRVFGGGRYDDRLTRGRLRQAYGRLVRRADDRGVFVLLDPALPSRLTGAFPPGVEVERVGLAEAVEITRAFVGTRGITTATQAVTVARASGLGSARLSTSRCSHVRLRVGAPAQAGRRSAGAPLAGHGGGRRPRRGRGLRLAMPTARASKAVPRINRLELTLLKGIDRVRDILLDNTRRFARGLPANNALLVGRRGAWAKAR